LAPGEVSSINVNFEPENTTEKQSGTVDGQLFISYKDHPQKSIVDLFAKLAYPNLSFDKKEIDFGCISNYTEKRTFVTLTNTSNLPVKYRWTFLASVSMQIAPGVYLFQGKQRGRRWVESGLRYFAHIWALVWRGIRNN
jgi:uncharacterized protein YozE (UPF0346 family)